MNEYQIYEKELSDKILGCAFRVYNHFGCGYLEKVYENSLVKELQENNLHCKQQYPISVKYKDEIVGEYLADILVEGKIILELKVCDHISDINIAQMINYLKATGIKLGYLFNFGNKKDLDYKRIIY